MVWYRFATCPEIRNELVRQQHGEAGRSSLWQPEEKMRLEMWRCVFEDGLHAVDGQCDETCVMMMARCKVGGLASCKRICEKESVATRRRKARDDKFDSAFKREILTSYEYEEWMNLVARFWTDSSALMIYAWWGFQMAAAYSSCGLINDLYARSLTCCGAWRRWRFKNPNVLFADEMTLVACGIQERSWDRITPKYLYVVTDSTGTFAIV